MKVIKIKIMDNEAGEQRGASAPCPSFWGAGGAKVPFLKCNIIFYKH